MPEEQAITAEEFATWLTPAAAIKLLEAEFTEFDASEMIFGRLQSGDISSAAKTVYLPEKDERHNYQRMPKKTWHNITEESDFDAFWRRGDLTIVIYDPHFMKRAHIRFQGVRFDPANINDILPLQNSSAVLAVPSTGTPLQPTPYAPEPTPAQNLGGRPKADWWEDLWIEMCRQIYAGDLKFTKQSEIESAMHEYLASLNKSAGVQTIRRAARKLWAVLQKEDQN